MKKMISFFTGVAFCSCFVATAIAADYAQDATTGVVTVEATNGTNATVDLTFNPSTSVIITGASNSASFAHSAYHTSVENKTSGKQFAMASDGSGVYFLDISPDGIGTSVDNAGDSTIADIFSSNGAWHTM